MNGGSAILIVSYVLDAILTPSSPACAVSGEGGRGGHEASSPVSLAKRFQNQLGTDLWINTAVLRNLATGS